LEYGLRALGDHAWQDAMRSRLSSEAAKLDALLAAYGAPADGGTGLFRHVTNSEAVRLFDCLGSGSIFVRNFADRPQALRFGLPGNETAWFRLEHALAIWRDGEGDAGPWTEIPR
jgi:cobalamin biosynthetic protein CobC